MDIFTLQYLYRNLYNIISEIGNVERFPNSDKLAQFCGVCPVNFSSAGKGKDQRSRQGNRVLNAIFHFLAIQLVQISPSGKPRQSTSPFTTA